MATAIVLSGIGLLAVPMRRLTGTPRLAAAMSAAAGPASPAKRLSAVLRLHTLAPARRLAITSPDGQLLWEARDLPAGETEHEAALTLDVGQLDLQLVADFPGLAGETAVFLTVMPDGMEDRAAHAVGPSPLSATLHFAWP